jgi:hypothetical protein
MHIPHLELGIPNFLVININNIFNNNIQGLPVGISMVVAVESYLVDRLALFQAIFDIEQCKNN